jgi:hypothetical protein
LKEADLAFWEVVRGKLSIDDYVDQYGLRATEASLVIPTIGEDKRELQRWVNSFKGAKIPDFERINKEVLGKRKRREKYVKENFRSWVPLGRAVFAKVLEIGRDYIPVRETRRFYYTMPTFYIRKGFLELGKRLDFLEKPSDIFFLTKGELEKAVFKSEDIDWSWIKIQVVERKKQWEERSKKVPPEEIEL